MAFDEGATIGVFGPIKSECRNGWGGNRGDEHAADDL